MLYFQMEIFGKGSPYDHLQSYRDGVSFPGVLRGGSVLGWSETGQLQADARRCV